MVPPRAALCLIDLLPPPERKAERKLSEPEKTSAADMKPGFAELEKALHAKNPGKLSLDEIGKGISDPAIAGSAAQILVVLKTKFDKLERLDQPAHNKEKYISSKAIDKFDEMQRQVKAGERKDEYAVKLVNEVESVMKQVHETSKKTVHALYADEKNPLKSLKLENVRQASIGNCYFYGAVGAVLSSDPAMIKNLITDNKNGTYTVKFPGQTPETVKAISEAEMFLFPKPGQDGTWMWALEKAYGQHCMKSDHAFRKVVGYPDTPVPQDHTNGPSLDDAGLKILTGRGTRWQWNTNEEKMAAKLKDLTSETPPRPITADATILVHKDQGAVRWHTYSVTHYDAKDQIVTLRNPWGSTPPADSKDLGDGKFSMSVATFCKYFSKISYAER